MSTREELYGHIYRAFDALDDPNEERDTPRIITDELLAAGYSKPRTITTVEELDALPNGSVLKHDELGHVAVRWSIQNWVIAGADGDCHYEDIRAALPLTLLYSPEPKSA